MRIAKFCRRGSTSQQAAPGAGFGTRVSIVCNVILEALHGYDMAVS